MRAHLSSLLLLSLLATAASAQVAGCDAVSIEAFGRVVAGCTVAGPDIDARVVGDNPGFAFHDDPNAVSADKTGHDAAASSSAQMGRHARDWRVVAGAAAPEGCGVPPETDPRTPMSGAPGCDGVERTAATCQRWFCDDSEAGGAPPVDGDRQSDHPLTD